tara:strand:- start:294 stop:719 length:426 start_codon:yes stop_codon:yes gene_type:complete
MIMKTLLLLLMIPFLGFGQTKAVKEYFDNGQLLSEINYADGQRNGLCENYWKNGQLWGGGNYKDGKMVGVWKSYYENGQLREEGSYKYTEAGVYSRKDGVWKSYYESGELSIESVIKDGVQVKYISYEKDGSITPMGEGGC